MDRIFITPLANKLASLNSINLANVKGSGPRGRITKVDIEKHLNGNSNSAKTKHQDNLDQEFDIAYEQIEIPKIRKILAQKLTHSKSSIPHFYLRRNAKVDDLISFRAQANYALVENNKISLNDFVIKDCGLDLTDFPDCNMIWQEQHMLRFKSSNWSSNINRSWALYANTKKCG